MRTRFTDLVGCRLPFQLAALGGVGTLELARAVARAGGLGMVPLTVDLPAEPEPGPGALGKNFLIPYAPSPEQVRAVGRAARVVEFFWGTPEAALVEAGHAAGALVSWQVGSPEEARAAEAAGCDLVVIQGVEAGGHVRGRRPLDGLLEPVLGAVAVPVVAAGGIGTGRRVAELLAAGADAVRVGTRFLAAPECDAHDDYVAALIGAGPADAVLTDHFDNEGAWPATVRVLAASLTAAEAAGNRRTLPPVRGALEPSSMPWYAGLGVEHVRRVQPAAEIVAELVGGLE